MTQEKVREHSHHSVRRAGGRQRPHVTRHGVTLTEIETLLFTATRFARNKPGAAGDYVAVGNGFRVNFTYRRKDQTARPIGAWRL